MLDKMSKQILKYCILHYDKKSDCCIKLTPATLNISYKLFNTATVHLIKNNLIEPCVSAYSDRDNIERHLTSKGLYYFSQHRKEQIFHWLPIAISIISLIRPEIEKIILLLLELCKK